ncbi:hypothetical protein BS17DRAFT_477855 [Gyrodon lividus]|nr:hypothetical protein BS17DRAFT_477855 [Gyrodon lividus]
MAANVSRYFHDRYYVEPAEFGVLPSNHTLFHRSKSLPLLTPDKGLLIAMRPMSSHAVFDDGLVASEFQVSKLAPRLTNYIVTRIPYVFSNAKSPFHPVEVLMDSRRSTTAQVNVSAHWVKNDAHWKTNWRGLTLLNGLGVPCVIWYFKYHCVPRP